MEKTEFTYMSPLVVLQILIFPNLPAIIYFSESSTSCCMHCIQVSYLHSVAKTECSGLISFYLTLELLYVTL